MQKTLFRPDDVTNVILKKITSSLLFIFLLITFPSFVKSNTLGNEDNSKIIVSGDVTIFESEDLLNDKTLYKDSKKIAEQQAVIFVSEGVLVYHVEAFNNAKVIKLEKTKNLGKQAKKKTFKITNFAKAQAKEIKNKPKPAYYHSKKNSDVFSKSSKKEILFSPNNSQSFSTIISVAKITNKKLQPFFKQNFSYTNPNIKACHFSGKYSIRPPTLFS